jgi:hypothetical protein
LPRHHGVEALLIEYNVEMTEDEDDLI